MRACNNASVLPDRWSTDQSEGPSGHRAVPMYMHGTDKKAANEHCLHFYLTFGLSPANCNLSLRQPGRPRCILLFSMSVEVKTVLEVSELEQIPLAVRLAGNCEDHVERCAGIYGRHGDLIFFGLVTVVVVVVLVLVILQLAFLP